MSLQWPLLPTLASFADLCSELGIKLQSVSPQKKKRDVYSHERAFELAIEHADALVCVGLILWFRLSRRRSETRTKVEKSQQYNTTKSWRQGPVPLYVSIAFWHPYVQMTLWPCVDAIVPYNIPVRQIFGSLDLSYFVGFAVWHRFLGGANHSRPNTATENNNPRRRRFRTVDSDDGKDDNVMDYNVIEAYQQNRKRNFKDPSLYAFMDKCQQAKQNLRPVADPWTTRNEKLARLRQEAKAKPTGPLQLSEDKLQSIRQALTPTNVDTSC